MVSNTSNINQLMSAETLQEITIFGSNGARSMVVFLLFSVCKSTIVNVHAVALLAFLLPVTITNVGRTLTNF